MCIFCIGGKLPYMIYLFGKCVCHDALAMALGFGDFVAVSAIALTGDEPSKP